MTKHGNESDCAVILAGSVAKGAFQAGALQALTESGVRVRRIVAASAGALNGCLFGASVYAGRQEEGAEHLVRLWRDRADWSSVFRLSVADALGLRGLSSSAKLIRLLQEQVAVFVPGKRKPVELRLIVTALRGRPATAQACQPVKFEHVLRFSGGDYEERPYEIFKGAAASAAFPVAFAPVHITTERVGPSLDGGLVNNTPVKYALRDEAGESSGIKRIYVIVPQPIRAHSPRNLTGADLFMHLTDILVHERLHRDLAEAEWVNDTLRRLSASDLPHEAQKKVREAIGLGRARAVELVQIRPAEPLDGNAFSGFSNAMLRKKYIAVGYKAAFEAMRVHGLGRTGPQPRAA